MDVELKNNHGNTALDLATNERTRKFLLNLIHRDSCLSCEKEFDFKNWKFYCSLCKCGFCGDCTILEERVSKNDKELYIYKRYCRQCLSELKFSEEEVRRTLVPEGRNLEENDIPILQEVINKAINKDADNILVDESHKAYNSLLASVALEKVIDKVNQSRYIIYYIYFLFFCLSFLFHFFFLSFFILISLFLFNFIISYFLLLL